MSRLNATIKLFFCIGELFLVLLSLGLVGASSLVVLGQVQALAFPAAQKTSKYILLLSAVVLLCTCFGCCGAFRQTVRRGCSGRRVLGLHQLLLLTVLVFSYSQLDWLEKRQRSLELIIHDPIAHQEFDSFEKRVAKFIDGAYFESICTGSDRSTQWLLDFVDKHCPASMRQENCALTGKKKDTCDTSCIKDDLSKCCPSEIPCIEGNKFACPYHQCRVELMEELFVWTGPAKLATQLACLLSALMLVLSCLLICYNKRDEIEIELLKSGVMNEEDIEAIRRLKEANNVTNNRGSISLESIDSVKTDQKRSILTRKRLNRISP